LLAAGHISSPEATLGEVFAFVEESGERFWLARTASDRRSNRTSAAGTRHDGRASVLPQGHRTRPASPLELRAATDLARVWRDTGSRQTDAH
jgi:hypothetical protein